MSTAVGSRDLIITYLLSMITLRYVLRAPSVLRGRCFSSSRKAFQYGPNKGDDYFKVLQQHQSKVVRLPMAEEIRTILSQSSGFGVISTNSVQYPGYPTGSVVGFQLDENGNPFFVFSSMSFHTKDIKQDGRSSLVVTAKNFKGAAEGRITLIGEISKVADDYRLRSLREQYLQRHKDAYWIDFG
jgi:hypothetical protein